MSMRMLDKGKNIKHAKQKLKFYWWESKINVQCLLKFEKIQRTSHSINNKDQIFWYVFSPDKTFPITLVGKWKYIRKQETKEIKRNMKRKKEKESSPAELTQMAVGVLEWGIRAVFRQTEAWVHWGVLWTLGNWSPVWPNISVNILECVGIVYQPLASDEQPVFRNKQDAKETVRKKALVRITKVSSGLVESALPQVSDIIHIL